jgi:uncharacterized surface protein with fasciclin (FAS1) repeats
MKNLKYLQILMLAVFVGLFTNCVDQTPLTLTSKQDMMGAYLKKDSTVFSSFYKMAVRAKLDGLLNSYGSYTCFAPNNAAVDSFVQNSQYKTIDNFPVDSLAKIVKYHLIEGASILSATFTAGRLNSSNMMGDNLLISLSAGDLKTIYKINKASQIISADNLVKNGVIYEVNSVIMPSKDNVVGVLNDESFAGRYSIFLQALDSTGVSKLLLPYEDKVNTFSFTNSTGVTVTIPRKFKFTLLVESDELYKKNGINSFADLKNKYNTGIAQNNLQDVNNGLYRFMAYHCLDRIYDYTDFFTFTYPDGYEVIQTMCPNTLIEFRRWATPVVGAFNRFTDDAGTVLKEGSTINATYQNIAANNGMVHELNSILEIPDQNQYFYKKMRFNICGMQPELMNNGISTSRFRGSVSQDFVDAAFGGPQYFKNLKIIGEAGQVVPRYDYSKTWIRHQYDEMLIGVGGGTSAWMNTRYDVYVTTPPIPKGTWQIRVAFTENQFRGMTQIYFDGVPQGMPVNMMWHQDYGINLTLDEETNRKILYNNGYLFYPYNVTNGNGDVANLATQPTLERLRRVICISSFSEMKQHVIRFKAVEGGQLSLNFLEILPVDQIESEGYN